MRKYFFIARAEWLDALQNYAEVIVWIIIETIPIIVISYVWLSNAENLSSNLTANQLVTYYFIVLVVSRLIGFYFDQSTQEQIRDGTFSRYLLKPIRVPLAFIPQNLGGKLFNTIFLFIPIIGISFLIFRQQISITPSAGWLVFLISLGVAYFINFFICKIITTIAFFWEQSFAFTHVKWVLENVAGGYLLPLSLYPNWMKFFANFLPFKYLYYYPSALYVGDLVGKEILTGLLVGVMWVLFLGYFAHNFWRAGLKRYSSVGG